MDGRITVEALQELKDMFDKRDIPSEPSYIHTVDGMYKVLPSWKKSHQPLPKWHVELIEEY